MHHLKIRCIYSSIYILSLDFALGYYMLSNKHLNSNHQTLYHLFLYVYFSHFKLILNVLLLFTCWPMYTISPPGREGERSMDRVALYVIIMISADCWLLWCLHLSSIQPMLCVWAVLIVLMLTPPSSCLPNGGEDWTHQRRGEVGPHQT